MKEHPLEKFKFCPACGSSHFEVNNVKSKKCADCGFVYYCNIAAAVGCFIIDAQGRYLVGVRLKEPAQGTLDLLGGFVDVGETSEEAVLREVKEECGLELEAGQIRYLFSCPDYYPYSGMVVNVLSYFYECRVESFDGLLASDDIGELKVMELSEMDPSMFGLIAIHDAVARYVTDKDVGRIFP